jgi:thioesterase domain-containing protein
MAETKADPNLFALRPIAGGARRPLFLIGVPGVNALGYVALARGLPAEQPVYVVQPTRRGRLFPSEGIGPGGRDEYPILAEEYLASIRTVQPEGPYFLAGSCDGAFVAFEMTRRLEAEGQRVAVLAIVDTWPLENTAIYPLVMVKVWERRWQETEPAQRRALVRRKAAEVIGRGAAIVRARVLGQEPPAAPPVKPTPYTLRPARWRARLWPGPEFRTPVVQAPIVVLRVPEQPYWRIRDHALGWRGRTRGAVTVHVLSGDHLNWARAPHVAGFSRALATYLETAPPAAPAAPAAQTAEAPARAQSLLDVVKMGAQELFTRLQRGP